MSSFRPWAFWRRLQYGAGFVALWAMTAAGVYFVYFATEPTCFDGIQNGTEAAIDCDGSCVRICALSVIPPQVTWAESFRIIDGQYNAVAYVENKNSEAATPALSYTFKLYDGGEVIAERSGVTILPPNSVYPIFEGRILTTGGRVPTRTEIVLAPAEMW